MSKPSRSSSTAADRSGRASKAANVAAGDFTATLASANAIGARADSCAGMPASISAESPSRSPPPARRRETRRGAAEQVLVARNLVRKRQDLHQVAAMHVAVRSEQTDGGGDGRLSLARSGLLQSGEDGDLRLVA